ncbi:proline-rich family protein isoform X1 [Wolffia australiana]
MKTTKGGKVMNPTDAYRKELRKKELKRNKKERKKVREVGILKKDPEAIRDQIQKLEMMKADGALDKARKHKKRQLEDTLNMVVKKRKEYEEKMREKGETPVMFSHLGPPRKPGIGDDKASHLRPEDSVYYHPMLNPTGAPPPGKPPMYKSSLEIPSSSSAAAGSTSNSETEEMPPPPPPLPPPPLPDSDLPSDDHSIPVSVPPPPPPPPSQPNSQSLSLPPQGIPPPPPGLPPPLRESIAGSHPLMPPLPPPSQSQLAEQGEDGEPSEAPANLYPLPPPPPPGLPPKQQLAPQPGPIRFPMQPDLLPPGIPQIHSMAAPHLPPLHGLPPQPYPPGMAMPTSILPMPPFPPGHALPPMFRPPLPPGQPFLHNDEAAAMRPPKPSYVKSAASTVVKRPLAQHNLELTSMVPASVRVRRETTAPKMKPRAQALAPSTSSARPPSRSPVVKSAPSSSSSTKNPTMDDSYMAFLEDMKALGALDS